LGGGSNTWVGNESAADSLDIGCNFNKYGDVTEAVVTQCCSSATIDDSVVQCVILRGG
jgi:hypothetical protein